MAARVRVRNPQCEVTFVSHRYGELPARLVAPALLDVLTVKRLGDPAASFQITLAPIVPPALAQLRRRWEDLLAPMDYVEIAMWEPPRPRRVVLRGFVDALGEVFGMHAEQPHRQVIVAGRNYGKLLLISRLWYVSHVTERQEIRIFREWTNAYNRITSRDGSGSPGTPDQPRLERGRTLPASGNIFKPEEVLQVAYEGFYQPQEREILAQFVDSTRIPRMGFVVETASDDDRLTMYSPLTVPLSYQPYQDIWSILRAFQHHPWRELLIQERLAGPTLVYRPTPWLNSGGEQVQPWGLSVAVHPIAMDRVLAWSVFRSDADVKNFFFVRPGQMDAYAMAHRVTTGPLEGTGVPGFSGNPHLIGGGQGQPNSYQRFGVRLHEVHTPYLNSELAWQAGDVETRIEEVRRQGREENRRLVEALGHEEQLERGTFLIPGDERIQVGHYALLTPHPTQAGWLYYVEGLQHSFRLGPGVDEARWQMRLDVTRGRGHLTREAAAPDVYVPPAEPPLPPGDPGDLEGPELEL